jgi:hypothetical protein
MIPSELPQDEDVCSDSDSDSDEGTDSGEESHEDDEERGVNDTEVEEMTAELGALVELPAGKPGCICCHTIRNIV